MTDRQTAYKPYIYIYIYIDTDIVVIKAYWVLGLIGKSFEYEDLDVTVKFYILKNSLDVKKKRCSPVQNGQCKKVVESKGPAKNWL